MISCADPAQLGERTASELSSVGGEQVGEVQQAFSSAANEVLAGTTTGNSISPSVAWIPRLQQGAQPTGQAVADFTRNDIAYASYSVNWFASTPVWNAASSYNPVPDQSWPPPDNLCDFYPGLNDCDPTSPTTWHATFRYRHAAKALGTGLEDVAAIVATAGNGAAPHGDVMLVTSVDAGVSFTRSLILSIPSLSGVQSGGDVDPESVHASLAYVGESNSPRGGVVGQPIYVTWRTSEGINRPDSWWFTRVVVGASGTAAETMRPRQLRFVPAVASTQASIFGYRLEGHEHIGVAWSERSDETTNCDADPNATTSVKWYASQTDTFGDEWGCFDGFHSVYPGPFPLPFVGCDPSEGRTLIAEEPQWKKCVWDVVDGRGARNTGRPEVAMNAPMGWGGVDREFDFAKAWYFAVNHRTPTSNGGMRVCLYATGNLGGEVNDHLKNPYCSPDQDPVSNDDIIDAWAPSLAIMQGSGYEFYPAPLVGDPYLLGMVYRASSRGGARTLATTGHGHTMNFYDDTLSVDGTGVPNTYADNPGLQLGLMVHQPCEGTVAGCSLSGSIFHPNIPFLAVWPDTRGTPTGNEIYSRSFVW